MKNFAIMLALLLATVSVSAQNTKKQDWAQFYVFQKDNARIAEMIKDTPKGKCPKCEWKLRKIKAVLMGDSITELWWDLDSTFFRDNNFVGRGISGQTTSEMLVRFRTDVLDLNPEYVFIMAGTNDVAENNGKITLENILGNLWWNLPKHIILSLYSAPFRLQRDLSGGKTFPRPRTSSS